MRGVLANLSVPAYLLTAAGRRVKDDIGWSRAGLLSLRHDLPLSLIHISEPTRRH